MIFLLVMLCTGIAASIVFLISTYFWEDEENGNDH